MMKKNVQLTEEELVSMIKKIIQEQESNEGVFDGLKDAAQGLKGVWRGEGYDYFKYISSLKNNLRQLQKLDKPNFAVIQNLGMLKNRIAASKMNQQKKTAITNAIDKATDHFNQYTAMINQIEVLASRKLN